MKNTVKVAALAFAAMALTVACNNNNASENAAPEEDTAMVEAVEEPAAPVETVEVAEEAPATTANEDDTKKAAEKKAAEMAKNLKAKQDVKSVSNDLQEGEGQSVEMKNQSAKQAAINRAKQKAAEAFKNNN